MSCPVCDGTMSSLGEMIGGKRWFWCDRCGALRAIADPSNRQEDYKPSLVARVRQFVTNTLAVPDRSPEEQQAVRDCFHRDGILEAIWPTGERP